MTEEGKRRSEVNRPLGLILEVHDIHRMVQKSRDPALSV